MATSRGAGASRESAGWTLGQCFSIWFAAFFAANVIGVVLLTATGYGGSDDPDPPLWLTAVLQVPLWSGLLGGLALTARRQGERVLDRVEVRPSWTVVLPGMSAGVAAQLLAVIVYLPFLPWLDDDVSQPARELTDRAEGLGIALLALFVVVAAPFVEELFYRGAVLGALEARYTPRVAWILSAVLFAVAHFQPLQFPALLIAGLVFGRMRTTRGLFCAMVAHGAFNLWTVSALIAERL